MVRPLLWFLKLSIAFLVIPSSFVLANAGADITYHTQVIRGWQVHYEAQLLKKNPAQLLKAFTILDDKLEQIAALVPKKAMAQLKQIPIWLSANQGVGLVYHSSAAWLIRHGRNPAIARGVELQNINDFIIWIESQPMVLLHEMAHAVHDQVFNYQHQGITSAFENANQKKLYQKVKRYDGARVRAYALENEREYFAELTEAYFGRNDFYPFNKHELKTYDPVGYKIVESIWQGDFVAPTLMVDKWDANDTIKQEASPDAASTIHEP